MVASANRLKLLMPPPDHQNPNPASNRDLVFSIFVSIFAGMGLGSIVPKSLILPPTRINMPVEIFVASIMAYSPLPLSIW
jgi:hypothetical protein